MTSFELSFKMTDQYYFEVGLNKWIYAYNRTGYKDM